MPVEEEMNIWCIASSSGCNVWLMPGIVLDKLVLDLIGYGQSCISCMWLRTKDVSQITNHLHPQLNLV